MNVECAVNNNMAMVIRIWCLDIDRWGMVKCVIIDLGNNLSPGRSATVNGI